MKNYFTLFSAKIKLPLLVAVIFFFMSAGATTHTVLVADFSFSPGTVNAVVGDTILWQWVSGSHTTTSLTVPSGAATWDSPMNSSNQTFAYVVNRPGTYTYDCTMHPTAMKGTINVTATAVTEVDNVTGVRIYPNPTQGQIEITASQTMQFIEVYDILGHQVEAKEINADNATLDLSGQAKGVYLIRIVTGHGSAVRKIIIGN